jgi:hypothetical protein
VKLAGLDPDSVDSLLVLVLGARGFSGGGLSVFRASSRDRELSPSLREIKHFKAIANSRMIIGSDRRESKILEVRR